MALSVPNIVVPYFDEAKPKYLFCCKTGHSASGSLLIGIVSVAIAGCVLIANLCTERVEVSKQIATELHVATSISIPFVVSLLFASLTALSSVCLLWGIYKQNGILLLPFLATQLLNVLLCVGQAFYLGFISFLGSHHLKVAVAISNLFMNCSPSCSSDHYSQVIADLSPTAICAILSALMFLIALCNIWLGSVVFSCYLYFGDRKLWFLKNSTIPEMSELPTEEQQQHGFAYSRMVD